MLTPQAGRSLHSAVVPARAKAEALRALVVEDDPCVRLTVSHLLRSVGYDVLCAESAEEGLDLLNAHAGAIRVLVSDIELPGMPGSELVSRARASWPGLAAVMMSGATTGRLVQRGLVARGARVLEKPFLPGELFEHVSSELRSVSP